MGGWCRYREQCQHYDCPTDRETNDNPAERLCEPGYEKVMFFRRVMDREWAQKEKT
jgi:hypothetical protein